MINFPNFYIAAIDTANKLAEATPNPPTSNTFIREWGTTISAILIAAIGGLWTWWNNRPKNKNDQFQIFMNESSEFREEVRKDKENIKAEMVSLVSEKTALLIEKKVLQEKIESCEKSSEDCADELKKLRIQLKEANKELDVLRVKTNAFRERIVELDANTDGKV